MKLIIMALVLSTSVCAQDRPFMLKGHRGCVRDIAFSPDGAILASVGDDNMARLWAVSSRQPIYSLKIHGGMRGVQAVAFSPDGGTLAAGSSTGTVLLWDITQGRPDSHIKLDYSYDQTGASIAFSPDGKLLAKGSDGGRGVLLLWEFGNSKPKLLLDDGLVYCVAFSPDGNTLAAGIPNRIILWDMSRRNVSWGVSHPLKEALGSRSKAPHAPRGMAFSPDSKVLASTDGFSIRLWNMETYIFQAILEGDSYRIFSMAFSPDGKTLASADGPSIRLWNMETNQIQAVLKAHKDRVTSMAFSPNGKILASGSCDKTIRFWRNLD